MPNLGPRFGKLENKGNLKRRSRLDPLTLLIPSLLQTLWTSQLVKPNKFEGTFGWVGSMVMASRNSTFPPLLPSFFLSFFFSFSYSFLPFFLPSPCLFFFFLMLQLHVVASPPFLLFFVASYYNVNKRSKHDRKLFSSPHELMLTTKQLRVQDLGDGGSNFGCHCQ